MEKLFKTLSSLIWAVLFLFFIDWYLQKWFGALKNGNIILFLLMSILPTYIVYTMCVEAFTPNVYHDMVDAQISAWKNQ
jgi:hypothetical protein